MALFTATALLPLQLQTNHAKTLGSSRNTYSNHLENLAGKQQSRAFSKLLRENGEQCPTVTRAMFRRDIGPNAFGNIGCSDEGQWMISIASNSWTRVTNCKRLAEAGTPCWTRL